MSADRKRLTSALRRIVKTDPDVRSLLKAAESKGGKPGAAGVGSSTEAQQARVCCDGSVGDANPGTGERDPDSGGQDGGLNSSDPALLGMGEGTLSGVTDCATGEPICFSGGGFIPPDGWDGPNEPPIHPEYVDGCRWWHTSDSGPDFATPDEAYYASSVFASQGPYCSRTVESGFSPCTGYRYVYRTLHNSGSCDVGAGNSSSRAGETAEEDIPRAESWPADSCVNLAIINGTIVGSKYDPENDGSYSAPRTSIDLCSGTDQISLAPSGSIEGGWKTLNSTNDSGYLYDSKGKVIAHIDGNEYSDPGV